MELFSKTGGVFLKRLGNAARMDELPRTMEWICFSLWKCENAFVLRL